MIVKRSVLLFVLIAYLSLTAEVFASSIKGKITDQETNEGVFGATIQIKGTSIGAVTDFDGNYEIKNVNQGTYTLEIRCVSYKTLIVDGIVVGSNSSTIKDFAIEAEKALLKEYNVVAKANRANEAILIEERKASSIPIENIGRREMSKKGISTVQEGVKKITGVSIADAGQLIVRGLGDRYSITTLNGLPIASPNPDNKLIPLDLFPTSVVQNITVSKVFEVGSFADYSGAHIDINTSENIEEDFLSVSFSYGHNFNNLYTDFYQMDNKSILSNNNLSKDVVKIESTTEFTNLLKQEDIFGTTFSVNQSISTPNIGAGITGGKEWKLSGDRKISLLASFDAENYNSARNDAFITTLNAQGVKLNEFYYDSYTKGLDIASLFDISYSFKNFDRISYTFFYARNATQNYKLRNGFDSEGINLVGSNGVNHIYSLLNNQLMGKHKLSDSWKLYWSGSFGFTSSLEPDRKQVMFRDDGDYLTLFKLNQQETMRYFGNLYEKELTGNARTTYTFGDNDNLLNFGVTYKFKRRDFTSTRFYYNVRNINPEVEEPYNTDDYLNHQNIVDEVITVRKNHQQRDEYYASSKIAAAFAELNFFPTRKLLLNAGLRLEYSKQAVDYGLTSGSRDTANLNKIDLFPAFNLKYMLNDYNNLRLSLSRTVTRPSFIEMSPFLYKESYGSAEIQGNDSILNGYNYNLDLRYEMFFENKDFISVGGYFKWLKNPIERIQKSSGGSAVHSFRNADNGLAAGIEVEFSKTLVKNLKLGLNGSLMYTNVILPENGGIYTDTKRALQGASPYLMNADLSYRVDLSDISSLNFALLYNLQGPRIHNVGIYGLGNVIQKAYNTLDFTFIYDITKYWSIKVKATNLLNSRMIFTQQIKDSQDVFEVERYKPGVGGSISISFNL